jgi:hypothetical protein
MCKPQFGQHSERERKEFVLTNVFLRGAEPLQLLAHLPFFGQSDFSEGRMMAFFAVFVVCVVGVLDKDFVSRLRVFELGSWRPC